MQKIFPLHCKISLTTYTRTVRFCLLQIQFFRVFNTQNLPVLLTLETVCRTPVQPLSSVSGHKRYNTLDFASKIVCQQGCCSPLLEAQSQGDFSLWIPHIFHSQADIQILSRIWKIYFLWKRKATVFISKDELCSFLSLLTTNDYFLSLFIYRFSPFIIAFTFLILSASNAFKSVIISWYSVGWLFPSSKNSDGVTPKYSQI